MVRERVVDRSALMDEYPGINPALADRVLTSTGKIGQGGILQLEREYSGYTGFRLLIDAHFRRKREGSEELAELAREAAERIADNLPDEERAAAKEALARLFPSEYVGGGSMRAEKVEGPQQDFSKRSLPEKSRGEVGAGEIPHPGNSVLWGLLQGFEKLANAGSGAEAEKMIGRAVRLMGKMEGMEAQRAIAGIEEMLGYRETARVLVRIMEREKRQEVAAKARVHFFYCISGIGGEVQRIAEEMKAVVAEPKAMEILGVLLAGKEWDARIMLLKEYPKIGIGCVLPVLDVPPEYARDKIELVKDAALEAGWPVIARGMGDLDLESTENCQLNLATAILDALNECDYANAGMAIEHAGLRGSGKGLKILEFLLDNGGALRHVKESAARALGLTGHEDAVDIAENCLGRWEKGDEAIRWAAYYSLEKLFYLDEPRIEHIISIGAKNEHEEPRTRLELIRWLGENGSSTCVSALQNVCGKSEDEKLMRAAARSLEKLSEESYRRSLPVPGGRGSRPTISVAPERGMLAPPVRITPIKKISRAPRNSSSSWGT